MTKIHSPKSGKIKHNSIRITLFHMLMNSTQLKMIIRKFTDILENDYAKQTLPILREHIWIITKTVKI